jgi:hypothetical protein
MIAHLSRRFRGVGRIHHLFHQVTHPSRLCLSQHRFDSDIIGILIGGWINGTAQTPPVQFTGSDQSAQHGRQSQDA